jgi:hypothetical protein
MDSPGRMLNRVHRHFLEIGFDGYEARAGPARLEAEEIPLSRCWDVRVNMGHLFLCGRTDTERVRSRRTKAGETQWRPQRGEYECRTCAGAWAQSQTTTLAAFYCV